MQAEFLDFEPTNRAAHFPRRDILGGKHGHYSAHAATNYRRVGRVVLGHFDLHTAAKYARDAHEQLVLPCNTAQQQPGFFVAAQGRHNRSPRAPSKKKVDICL